MWFIVIIPVFVVGIFADTDSDFNVVNNDGSFDFRYDNPDSFHESHGTRNKVVQGVFGGRNPKTGVIDNVEYTAGPRGFRPKGKNVVRKFDQSQRPVGPIGNKDDPYFDPYEDPSYNFQFNTRSYSRKEGANRVGDVKGSYSYFDDVGERHDVEYIAGKNTGFHVKTPYPDSNPGAYRTTYFRDPRKPYMRGRSFVQRGLDGSYRFAAVGPDQRRTETSDAVGNVRGSYTYRDEKGVQHSVHYIAGPNIGYRVLKNVKGPHLPTLFPFNSPSIVPSDFYDNKEKDLEVFSEAATSYVTPPPNRDNDHYFPDNTNQVDKSTNRPDGQSTDGFQDDDEEAFDDFFSSKPTSGRPTTPRPGITGRPPLGGRPTIGRPTTRPGRPTSTGRPISPGRPTTPGRPTSPGRPTTASYPSSTLSPTTSLFGGGITRPASTRPTTFGAPRPIADFGPPLDGDDDIDEDDLFGFSNKPKPSLPPLTRPSPGGLERPTSPTFGRPDTTSSTFGRPDTTSSTFGRPDTTSSTFGRPDTTSSTFGRPPFTSSTKPSTSSSTIGRPSTTTFGRPPTTSSTFGRPSTSSFGRPTTSGLPFLRPTSPTPSISRPDSTKPVLQVGVSEVEDGKYHTLVTNLGDTLFTVPPGVSVRAHVQNIDLIPVYARSPSPSEQYNADVDEEEEVQVNAETSNGHVTVFGNASTTEVTKTSTQEAVRSTTLEVTTAAGVVEGSSGKETDEEEGGDDDDDVDIF